MKWLMWQFCRWWVGCRESDCTYYRTRPDFHTAESWHELIHRGFLEKATITQARNWRLQRGRPVPTDMWWLWEAAGTEPKDLPHELVYWGNRGFENARERSIT